MQKETEENKKFVVSNAKLIDSAVLGILPKANSIFEYLYSEWRLPGHGKEYADCGDWRYRGCSNIEEHNQNELFSDVCGKLYVEFYHRSCGRADCPVCYESWCGHEAAKIEHKLNYTWRHGKVIHVAISPTEQDVKTLPFPELRSKMYQIAKSRGIKGGVAIFHPWRQDDNGITWRFAPHWHLLCYGWIRNVAELFKKDGWLVKNILDGETERSVFRTALYQLSHCGLCDTQRTITWFGVCSTAGKNAVKIPEMPKEAHICPCCGRELVKLHYSGDSEVLLESVDLALKGVWLNPSGWSELPKKNRFWSDD